MSTEIEFYVPGTPKAQPRVKATIRGKHAGVYTPKTADVFKASIIAAVRLETCGRVFTGPLRVELYFDMPRPKSHFGTGKKASEMKESAPYWHDQKSDVDNLSKAVLDALNNAGIWHDDAQVCQLAASKRWCLTGGVNIVIGQPNTSRK